MLYDNVADSVVISVLEVANSGTMYINAGLSLQQLFSELTPTLFLQYNCQELRLLNQTNGDECDKILLYLN